MKDESKKDVQRQKILEVARELFLKQGVSKTSITDISAQAGIAKGLVYYYFETKEDILDAVVALICEAKIKQLEHRLRHGESFYQRLMMLFDAYYALYPVHLNPPSLFLDEQGIVGQFHRYFLLHIEAISQKLIEEGQAQGILQCVAPRVLLEMSLEGIHALHRMNRISLDEAIQGLGNALQIDVERLREYKHSLVNMRKEYWHGKGNRTVADCGESLCKSQATRCKDHRNPHR